MTTIKVTPRRHFSDDYVFLEVVIDGHVAMAALGYGQTLPIDLEFTGLPEGYEHTGTTLQMDIKP